MSKHDEDWPLQRFDEPLRKVIESLAVWTLIVAGVCLLLLIGFGAGLYTMVRFCG